jgi:hypothetical protein
VASSLSSSTSPSLDATLNELTHLAASEKAIQARRQILLDALDQLVEAGEADEQIVWNDYKISRRTKQTYAYPEHIKAAQRLSVALGEATLTTSTFWVVRHPKP